MLVFWAVLTHPQVHMEVNRRLSALPPDPLAKNPACGVTKWGFQAVVLLAAAACCSGSFGFGCGACVLGGKVVSDTIDGIDCSKECKPDCPIG